MKKYLSQLLLKPFSSKRKGVVLGYGIFLNLVVLITFCVTFSHVLRYERSVHYAGRRRGPVWMLFLMFFIFTPMGYALAKAYPQVFSMEASWKRVERIVLALLFVGVPTLMLSITFFPNAFHIAFLTNLLPQAQYLLLGPVALLLLIGAILTPAWARYFAMVKRT